jgi:hypothetical protein
MRKITAAGLALGALGIICLAVPAAGSALAAYDRQPASAQPSASPSWASTWGPPTNFGPGTIAPNGAPTSIQMPGSSSSSAALSASSPTTSDPVASCPTVSGNQQNGNQQNGSQQNGNQSGGHRHKRHGRGTTQGGQQPAPTASPTQPPVSGS